MYVTQSCMTRQKTDSGKLMSCVYRFPLDAEGIHCTNTLADPHIFLTFITENPKCQYGVDGIVFDHDGNLYVGNFGDGVVHKITFNPDGSVKENRKWACDPANLKSTDGMTIDPYGNIYVADFSANAHRPHHPRRPGDADGLLPRHRRLPRRAGRAGRAVRLGGQDHRLLLRSGH